jgi:hypothetical protein
VSGDVRCDDGGSGDDWHARCATPFARSPCVDEPEEELDLGSSVVAAMALVGIAVGNPEARMVGHVGYSRGTE